MKTMQKLKEIKENIKQAIDSLKETVQKISESALIEKIGKATKAGLKGVAKLAGAADHLLLGAADVAIVVLDSGAAVGNTVIGVVKTVEYAGKKCVGSENAGEAGEAAIKRFRKAGKNVREAGGDVYEAGSEVIGLVKDSYGMLTQFSTMGLESCRAGKEAYIALRDGDLRAAEEYRDVSFKV